VYTRNMGAAAPCCCWYTSSGKWILGPTIHKDANEDKGYGISMQKYSSAPQLVKGWSVAIDGTNWEDAVPLALTNLSKGECDAGACGPLTTTPSRWECYVDGTWIEYNLDASDKLETAFAGGKWSVEFKYSVPGQSAHPYKFQHLQSVGKMTQTNQNTSVTREVRRIQTASVLDVQELDGDWSSPQIALGNGAFVRRLKVPEETTDLAEYTPENQAIKDCISQAMMLSSKLSFSDAESIDLIINPAAAARFNSCKAQLKAAGKPTNIMWVFHGTPKLEHAESIVKDAFKIGGVNGHPVSNGKVWGHAIYSDVKPDTPKAYGHFVLLCQALPGSHTKISKQHVNDPCPGYDSWEPDTKPTWRLFRKNEQLLPKYIIHLK
jgi:hypothetical protein